MMVEPRGKRIKVKKCPGCGGSGRRMKLSWKSQKVIGDEKCLICKGRGQVKAGKAEDVLKDRKAR